MGKTASRYGQEREGAVTAPTRKAIAGLKGYRPGGRPQDVAAPGSAGPQVKLSSNELPFGPLPSVVAAVQAAIGDLHRYPDFFARELLELLAEQIGVANNQVVVASGSSALCRHIVEASAEDGDQVLMARPTFQAYGRAAAIAGAQTVAVPLNPRFAHDLDAMHAAIGPATRVIFICNPNNPTGTAVSSADLTAFVRAVPDDVLIVVDEAYREFATDPAQVPNAVPLIAEHDNVVVVRTFSKAHGLAGLRVGYAVASPDFADSLRKVVTPFAGSTAGQLAAAASLRAQAEVLQRVRVVVAERLRVTEALRHAGIEVVESEANFVWLPIGSANAEFAAACEAEGVLVRPMPPDGVRVTIGTREENDMFLAAAAAWLKGHHGEGE
jgi:histidinol-phosphate aminotransferase